MSTVPVEPSAEQVASRWNEIAVNVAYLVRRHGRAHFREAVEQFAKERLEAENEKERRKAKRRDALKKSGVWQGPGKLPDRPEGEPGPDGEQTVSLWFEWGRVFRGRIKLPAGVKLPPKKPGSR